MSSSGLMTSLPTGRIISKRATLSTMFVAPLASPWFLRPSCGSRGNSSLSTPGAEPKTACYRCMFPEPPDADLVPRCEQAGVFGALAGVMGTLQAMEVLKLLLGLGESICGQLLLYDALDTRFRKIKMPRDANCLTCGRLDPARSGIVQPYDRVQVTWPEHL